MAHPQYFRQLRGDHNDRFPLRREIIEQLVDLGFGSHINPSCRFIENENVAVAVQPFADDDLLLVTAG
ncbi:hypothetical protein D3C86_1994400 [compost metagenome]